jgi:hypothetical protein
MPDLRRLIDALSNDCIWACPASPRTLPRPNHLSLASPRNLKEFKPSLGQFTRFALFAIYALCKLEPTKYLICFRCAGLRKVYGMI